MCAFGGSAWDRRPRARISPVWGLGPASATSQLIYARNRDTWTTTTTPMRAPVVVLSLLVASSRLWVGGSRKPRVRPPKPSPPPYMLPDGEIGNPNIFAAKTTATRGRTGPGQQLASRSPRSNSSTAISRRPELISFPNRSPLAGTSLCTRSTWPTTKGWATTGCRTYASGCAGTRR